MKLPRTTLLAAFLLTLACAGREGELVRVVEMQPPPAEWVGRSEADLLEAWGAPTERNSDGEGGSVLIYRRKFGTVNSGSDQPLDLPSRPGEMQTTPNDRRREEDIAVDAAKFWVDGLGQVYREWIHPRHGEKLREKRKRERGGRPVSPREGRAMAEAKTAVVRSVAEVESRPIVAGTATASQVLLGPDDGAPNFAMRRFVMGPGGGMPRHTNTVEHEQYVLRGRAEISVGEELHEVAPGTVLYIPAGMPHSYRVLEAPFEFLCMVPNRPDRIELVDGADEG